MLIQLGVILTFKEKVKNMEIRKIVKENEKLDPNLIEGTEVLKSWGFKYKTVGFTWVKTNKNKGYYSGLGFYTNSNCEICLIGRKGKFNRNSKKVKQLVVDQLREHSRKPDCVRDRIVELCGDLPRIELFARQKVEGWDCWGNEV